MAAAKRSIELREFRRLALWGASAAGAVALMVFALLSGSGQNRLVRTASQGVETAKLAVPHPAPASPAQTASAKETEGLTETVRTLTADRDRLRERIASLEQALEDVTGTVARTHAPHSDVSASEPPPAVAAPASVAEPMKFTPSGLALALAIPNSGLEAPQAPAIEPPASPAPATGVEPSAHDEFGVDLGRSATIEGLRSLWTTIRSRYGSLLEGLRPIVYVRPGDRPGRIELRLIVGPIGGPAAAAKLCAAMTAAGATCRPTAWDGRRLALQ